MKIVISALHFEWRDMDECVGRAREELGLDGAELSWHRGYTRAHCTRADLDVLAARREEIGASLSAHIWEDLAQSPAAEAEAALQGWLDECQRTGVTNIVVHGGTFPDQKQGIARVRGVLERVLPAFEKAGVVLNLENHYAYAYHGANELFSEPWEFMQVFSLDSPSLRFCFDTGHGHMTRNAQALIRELAPRLHYVHLADNHGVDDDHVGFRQGTVDWDGIFDALQSIGFDGTFCVEFPVRDDRAPFIRCVQELRDRWGNGQGG